MYKKISRDEKITLNKQEIVDIYDENKHKTGKTKIRHKDPISIGEYIIGVQAIIINSKKQILISQRSELKKNCLLNGNVMEVLYFLEKMQLMDLLEKFMKN